MFFSILYEFGFYSIIRLQSNDVRNSPKEMGPFNDSTRKFNGVKDVSRDFSNSQDNTDRGSMSDQAFACSASSVESLPSASGSSKNSFCYFYGLTKKKPPHCGKKSNLHFNDSLFFLFCLYFE